MTSFSAWCTPKPENKTQATSEKKTEITCPTCNGDGQDSRVFSYSPTFCDMCNGSGKLYLFLKTDTETGEEDYSMYMSQMDAWYYNEGFAERDEPYEWRRVNNDSANYTGAQKGSEETESEPDDNSDSGFLRAE